MNEQFTTIASGSCTILRDILASDVDFFLAIQTSGQWRNYDAPWEGVQDSLTPQEERDFREKFLAHLADEKPVPRKSAVVATLEGKPIGNVNRYTQHVHDKAWFVGISIFDDEYLDRGLGTEALRLWIDYLFANSEVHRIGLDTWSFNPRMMRVAHKLGFVYEGAQREMQLWQGSWLDLVHFGMLRTEWEALRG